MQTMVFTGRLAASLSDSVRLSNVRFQTRESWQFVSLLWRMTSLTAYAGGPDRGLAAPPPDRSRF